MVVFTAIFLSLPAFLAYAHNVLQVWLAGSPVMLWLLVWLLAALARTGAGRPPRVT